MTLALLTAGAAFAVEDGALQQPTAQDFSGRSESGKDFAALPDSLFLIHLYQ